MQFKLVAEVSDMLLKHDLCYLIDDIIEPSSAVSIGTCLTTLVMIGAVHQVACNCGQCSAMMIMAAQSVTFHDGYSCMVLTWLLFLCSYTHLQSGLGRSRPLCILG